MLHMKLEVMKLEARSQVCVTLEVFTLVVSLPLSKLWALRSLRGFVTLATFTSASALCTCGFFDLLRQPHMIMKNINLVIENNIKRSFKRGLVITAPSSLLSPSGTLKMYFLQKTKKNGTTSMADIIEDTLNERITWISDSIEDSSFNSSPV